MAAPTKRRLYDAPASVTVREGLTAADAADWVPEDESTPDDHILDAREWKSVRVFAEYVGSPGGSETVEVTPLMWVRTEAGGGAWRAMTAITGLDAEASSELQVDSHWMTFRATTVTLDSATAAHVRVTGGEKRHRDTF